MKRRDFMRLTAVGASATLLPNVNAAASKKSASAITADIYYTKDSLGRWEGKAATHLPSIEITKNKDELIIKVTTPHEMKGYEHYIVKHVLLDKNHKFLGEHLFDPTKENTPISSYTLKNYTGMVYALSFCNKHDLWLNSAEI